MSPRSKLALFAGVALPVVLVSGMWWAARSRPKTVALSYAKSPVLSLALSHDGSLLAVQEGDGKFSLLSLKDNQRFPLPMEESPASKSQTPSAIELSFSPDDKTVSARDVSLINTANAICSGLYTWDTQTRQIKWSVVSNARDDLGRFWLAPNGKLAIQSSYYVLKVMNISGAGTPRKTKLSKFARTFPVVGRFSGFIPFPTGGGAESFAALAISPDGKTTALLAPSDERIVFWNTATSQKQETTPAAPMLKNVLSDEQLAYSPDGKFLALCRWGQLLIWDMAAHKWTTTSVGSTHRYEMSLAWMPDSRSLWTNFGPVQQWSVPNLKPMRVLPVEGPFALSGDGRLLATSKPTATNGIWLWNIS